MREATKSGLGGFIWWHHVGMIMTILDPKGQPFILTLVCLAKLIIPPKHQRPATRQTAGENGTLKEKDETKQTPFPPPPSLSLDIPWNTLHLLAGWH